MKLSFNEIKNVTFGAINIIQSESEIEFFKCTNKQTENWYALSDILGARSLTTSGVRLDFHTSSKILRYTVSRGSKFEVLIDGVLRDRFTPTEEVKTRELPLCQSNGRAEDEVRVTLVFPSHSKGTLVSLELDDGATLIPHRHDRKILFIGDSITQGYNTKFDSLSYAWQTTLRFNADSVINGIGGAFYHISTFDKPNFDPDTVILAYGTNDASRYKNNYDEMYRQVTGYLDLVKEAYSDKKVIVISPIWRADSEGSFMGEWFDERRLMIEKEAKARGFEVISGLELVPPLPDFFADTYLHPNDLGFTVYALNLTRKLDKLLR